MVINAVFNLQAVESLIHEDEVISLIINPLIIITVLILCFDSNIAILSEL